MTTAKTEEESRQNKGVAELGTYMLKGWVLTDVICPNPGCNIPVVRSRDRSTQLCVLCDDPVNPYPPISQLAAETEVTIVEDPSVVPSTSEPTGAVTTPEEDAELEAVLNEEVTPSRNEAAERRREKGNQASKLLGQKMLAGWTMLEDTCPNPTCIGVPLMRSRQKQTICVMCDGQPAPQPNGVVPAAQLKAAAETKVTVVPEPIPKLSTLAEKALSETSAAKVRNDSPKRRKIDPTASSIDTLTDQVALTILTLTGRMEDLRQSVESSTTSVDDTRAICDAISSCAGAIVALQAVKRI
ncbi:hypothetical protein DFJ77DRAFT_454701 [Powellomyces hirtus]|nr:hypothetical protein DFJ77DRAFT_454701 [Powellomyces hirtus]